MFSAISQNTASQELSPLKMVSSIVLAQEVGSDLAEQSLFVTDNLNLANTTSEYSANLANNTASEMQVEGKVINVAQIVSNILMIASAVSVVALPLAGGAAAAGGLTTAATQTLQAGVQSISGVVSATGAAVQGGTQGLQGIIQQGVMNNQASSALASQDSSNAAAKVKENLGSQTEIANELAQMISNIYNTQTAYKV